MKYLCCNSTIFYQQDKENPTTGFSTTEASGIPASSLGGGNYSRREKYRQENP